MGDQGEVIPVGEYEAEQAVFSSPEAAFEYAKGLAIRDLQYRGFRDDRVRSFDYKQQANFLLYRRIRNCASEEEFEYWRQQWDCVNRPKRKDLRWSDDQRKALDLIRERTSLEDEEVKRQTKRWLYISGAPGTGKSEVILEGAITAAQAGMQVLIVCPTGQLAHAFKARLPEVDGIENITVDTIHGVLNYQRPGADKQVRWTPPTALRRMDLLLVDEGSQYDDREWSRFFSCVRELPHLPYVAVVADFQQLQPIVAGGLCKKHCALMETVELKTVYRCAGDQEHLLFQNRLRHTQPYRPMLEAYFGQRHWQRRQRSLEDCVREGMDIARKTGKPFTWLTATNAGTSHVCEAALRVLEVPTAELERGYLCDPTSKSDLRIVAKPGILLRLTRNFDKVRGFVNGALAEVVESLQGNAVFVPNGHH